MSFLHLFKFLQQNYGEVFFYKNKMKRAFKKQRDYFIDNLCSAQVNSDGKNSLLCPLQLDGSSFPGNMKAMVLFFLLFTERLFVHVKLEWVQM